MVGRVIQYPDTIRIIKEGESKFVNGEWVISESYFKDYKCRFVPNGAGSKIKLEDGSDYVYSYKIAFPLGTNDIFVMDNYEHLGTDYKGVIKQFEIGQLHSVAWV